ncbi:thioesterase family protein [Gordonia hankookensis]|uniref:Thioesterase family protein n=1 Tax=Gordonia hankookensis TaxID=589403 RepID=A0ABR7WHN5_9ACTN|nr:thioesterase family protein [Gordonia hankookensis]MBD1322278.1 thioesterase family protein [Gordonia hankookensis]NDZ96822.1 thioesterase family protein [Streptomyces sp. SID11726]NEB26010.1 thioesterase family protein [Streptomyces sp. SID6673]
MESCYYVPIDRPETQTPDAGAGVEYFQPTEATQSVWAATMQHGGPPSGLMMRSLLRCDPDPGQRFTRVTTEILGPIGLGVNRISAQVIRPGRQISLVGTDLEVQQPDGSFRLAARSVGWRLRTADTSAIAEEPAPLTPLPAELTPVAGVTGNEDLGVDWGTTGFIGSIESATIAGRTGDTPAVWIRPAIPLVGGEEISDLESVFSVIDIANGMGTRLRTDEWTWMNTDTTVHLTRTPSGPWVGIDADMVQGPDGYGATFADLFDTDGFIGRSAQTVLLSAL